MRQSRRIHQARSVLALNHDRDQVESEDLVVEIAHLEEGLVVGIGLQEGDREAESVHLEEDLEAGSARLEEGLEVVSVRLEEGLEAESVLLEKGHEAEIALPEEGLEVVIARPESDQEVGNVHLVEAKVEIGHPDIKAAEEVEVEAVIDAGVNEVNLATGEGRRVKAKSIQNETGKNPKRIQKLIARREGAAMMIKMTKNRIKKILRHLRRKKTQQTSVKV